MHIGKEARGVLLNLLNAEAKAGVHAIGSIDTGDKPVLGADDAANATAGVLIVGDLHRIGEGDARRAGLALNSLVDVRRRDGERLVLALEAGNGDVVADDVLLAIQAKFVDAVGAAETAGVGVVGVDNLVRGGNKLVGGGEVERRGLSDCGRC